MLIKNSQAIESPEETWDLVIKPKSGWLNIPFGEIYRYRDLIFMFVKRVFITFYKQTILAPCGILYSRWSIPSYLLLFSVNWHKSLLMASRRSYFIWQAQ